MRLLSWLAAFSVVVAIGAASALAVHDHTTRTTPITGARSSGLTASTGVLVADDPSPANRVHAPLGYTPPPAPTQAPGAQASGFVAPVAAAPRRAPAPPAIVIGSYMQTLINRDRAAAGLPPLTWSSCLASVAAANAVRLSRQGWVQPYHTNGPSLDLGCHLGNQAGENVGYWTGGINDGQLNTMFMNSPEHRANILGPYHYVATAWAVASNGYAYIAEEFS
jgi:uncharacterized protein YkwD